MRKGGGEMANVQIGAFPGCRNVVGGLPGRLGGLSGRYRITPLRHNAVRVRIHVHGVVTQKADERDATCVGKLDGEARRGGDGDNTRNTRQQSFLEYLV